MPNLVSPLSRDWAVLCQIDTNARLSFAEIGRRLGLSKETVANCLDRLTRNGIIGSYTTVVNVARLGLTPYVVYLQTRNFSESKKGEFVKYLVSRPEIYWVSRMGGNYDVLFGCTVRSILEFNITLTQIQGKLGNHIAKITIHTRIQTVQFARTYLSERAPNRNIKQLQNTLSFGNNFETLKLNDLDRQLVNLLCLDSRISVTELAERLSVTRSTITSHINELEQRGIIEGYAANIHAEALGYQIYRLLLAIEGRSPVAINNIYRFAIENPNIVFFDFGIGSWDLELTVEIKDQKELQKLVSSLRDRFSAAITSLEIIVVFEDNVKYQFAIPPP